MRGCHDRHRLLGLVAALWICWAGCDCRDPAASRSGSEPEATATPKATAPPSPTRAHGQRPASSAAAHVKAVEGAAALEGAPRALSAGVRVPPERTLELPAGATLTLDMPGGARVVLSGPARARLGGERLRQLILAYGEAHVQLAPEGATRRLSLRVATPELALELAARAEGWLGVSKDGGSYVGLASGAAVADAGGSGSEPGQRDERIELAPGQALLAARQRIAVVGGALQATPGAATITAIASQGRAALRRQAMSSAASHSPAPSLEAALGESVARLEGLRAEGERLTARQRAAKATGEQNEVKRVQRGLVAYAQRLYRLRRRTLVLWERLQAGALRDGRIAALADQAARVRALIGAVDP